jgi:hypothetical protein
MLKAGSIRISAKSSHCVILLLTRGQAAVFYAGHEVIGGADPLDLDEKDRRQDPDGCRVPFSALLRPPARKPFMMPFTWRTGAAIRAQSRGRQG